MRLGKRWGALALAAATAVGMMSGCTQLEEKTESDTVAATFGDEDIMLDYVMLQMRSAQYNYEAMFSVWYGTTDFWDQAYNETTTIESYVINSIMQSIRQTKILCDYAEKNGIALDDEQKQKVTDAVAKAMEDEEYSALIGINEELLNQIYTENALANLAYMDLVADVDTSVGEDEFIHKDFAYVRLAPSDLEENSLQESSTGVNEDTTEETVSEAEPKSSEEESLTENESETESQTESESESETAAESESESEEESESESDTETQEETDEETTISEEEQETRQRENMESAAEEILARMKDGELPADFISEYNEDTTYFTATQSTTTLNAESTLAYAEDAFALSMNECVIYNDETTGAIYILLCTNDNDQEARQTAIDSEIESRKATLFAEKYAEVQEASPKFEVDQEVIGKINFHTALYVPETVTETTLEEEQSTETSEAESETIEIESSEEETSEIKGSENETSTEETSEAEVSKENEEQK